MAQHVYLALVIAVLILVLGELPLLWWVLLQIRRHLSAQNVSLESLMEALQTLESEIQMLVPSRPNLAISGNEAERPAAPTAVGQTSLLTPVRSSGDIRVGRPASQLLPPTVRDAGPEGSRLSGTTPRRYGDSPGPKGRISLLIPKTTGLRTENIEVGSLDGTWTDKKEFSVENIRISGELSRSRVFEIAHRLSLMETIQRSLQGAGNDDPIFFDLACNLDAAGPRTVVRTRVPGEEQELSACLIPAVALDPSALEVRVDDSSRPLRLQVRSSQRRV